MSEVADKYHKMESDMTEIRLRMKRMDRAANWYDSLVRRIIILAVTYVASLGLMLALQVQNVAVNALIPVIPVAVDLLMELILRKRWSK